MISFLLLQLLQGPLAKSGSWRPNNWPAEQCQSTEEI